MNLTRGKVPQAIVRPPTTAEWHTYATALRDELDAFFDDSPTRNELVILRSGDTGLVAITLHLNTRKQFPVKILSADAAGADHLRRAQTALVEQKSQWVYFQRNLIAYEGNQTFLMKPAKRLYWTVSEAISDAGTLIADAITAPLPDPPLVAAAT